MIIPRIIHQTWKNEFVPEVFKEMAFSCREKHTDWKYLFWTDEMNRDFIKEHFPFFIHRYDAYTANIQRVDAVRYFVLYKYGGVYVDLDIECLANITPLVEDAECVFGKEPDEHCRIHNKNVIISNAFMASVPGHEFFGALCTELDTNKPVTDHPNDKILESTGPFMLSRIFGEYSGKKNIKLVEADLIYPLSKEELERNNASKDDFREKLRNAYAIHHYAGTWWKKDMQLK